MNPTVTVRQGDVLTLDEKFQSGIGINFTPPPSEYVAPSLIPVIKTNILRLSRAIGLEGFARIDAFLNCNNGELKIIEINTLPGMSPATAIFHQSMSETPPIYPAEFLELAIDEGWRRWKVSSQENEERL